MTLVVVPPKKGKKAQTDKEWVDDRPDLPPPPDVAVTPCDIGWPRPYFLENGLRRVAPYYYTYNTFCKQRWRGREILDIFAAEFRDRTPEYYQQAIEKGLITLNGKPCGIDTPVQNGDVISHTLHRHEPPVTAQAIGTIFEDDDMIVIDKPAGVPVHPAGRYKYNSVVEIMRAERSQAFNPLPCNRLDRLTSGVMFIGKTGKKAEMISKKLRQRTVRKEYVARVKGRFPDGVEWDGDQMRGGVVKCDEPILQISPVLGLNRARASGKTAKTLFRRIAYYPTEGAVKSSSLTNETNTSNEDPGPTTTTTKPTIPGHEDVGYSIVHCLPLTGRTHQIRVHLQFLGHPISNDPIYSNRRVFGADLGRNDNSAEKDAEIMERLGRIGKTEVVDTNADVDGRESRAGAESKSVKKPSSEGVDMSLLVDQTQQMTLSDVIRIEQEQQRRQSQLETEGQELGTVTTITTTAAAAAQSQNAQDERNLPEQARPKPLTNSVPSQAYTPDTSDSKTPRPTPQNTYKPLPQSLHVGPLPSSVMEQLNSSSSTNTATATDGSEPSNNPFDPSDPLYAAYITAHDEAVADYNKRKGEKLTGQVCNLCQTPLYSDPGPQELGIYLHALAYADLDGEWRYTSAMPAWAKPPRHDDHDDHDDSDSDKDSSVNRPSARLPTPKGPTSIPEWIYHGAAAEGLVHSISDEAELESLANDTGMKRNRELEDGACKGR